MSKYGVFSGRLFFPAFGLKTERYEVSLRIQSECRKIRPEKTPYLDTFHTVMGRVVDVMLDLYNNFPQISSDFPVNIFLFKVNNRNTRNRCEICSKLIIKTPERRQRRRSCVFIVNFEHISHLFLVFLLLS